MLRGLSYTATAGVAICLAVMAAPARSASRFDIIDGNLVDNSTGLVWQSLSATAGNPLPLTPQVGDWRVATIPQVQALFPMTAGQVQIVSKDSDAYQALSFFAANAPAVPQCDERAGAQGAHCFGAWAVGWPYGADGDARTNYEYQTAWFVDVPGQAGQVSFASNGTIGSYSASFCPSDLCAAGQFTVRAVPESSSLALMLLGLFAVAGAATAKARTSRAPSAR